MKHIVTVISYTHRTKVGLFKPIVVLACIIIATVLPMPCKADVKSDFANPPLKFRSRPLWFWNNANVTAAEVEAQLQGNRDQSGYGGLAPLPIPSHFPPVR